MKKEIKKKKVIIIYERSELIIQAERERETYEMILFFLLLREMIPNCGNLVMR